MDSIYVRNIGKSKSYLYLPGATVRHYEQFMRVLAFWRIKSRLGWFLVRVFMKLKEELPP